MTVITLKAYWLHSERHVTASRATQCYVASRRSENSEITVTGKEKKLPVKDYSYFTKENANFGKPWHRQSHIGRWTDSTRRKFWEFTIVLYRCYCVLSIFPGLCSILPPPLPPKKTPCKGIKFTAPRTQISELYFWFVKRRWSRLFALFITVQQWERERDAISSTSGRFVCPSGSAERRAKLPRARNILSVLPSRP